LLPLSSRRPCAHRERIRCSKLTFSNTSLFPLILWLCLALNPNNQYNLGPFCTINATLLTKTPTLLTENCRTGSLVPLKPMTKLVLISVEAGSGPCCSQFVYVKGLALGEMKDISGSAGRKSGLLPKIQRQNSQLTCGGSALCSGFIIVILRARMPVYFVWMHKACPSGSIQMSTFINVAQQNELLLPLSLFPSLVQSLSVTTVFCPIRV